MDTLFFASIVLTCFLLVAIAHEYDLSRNFKKTGDAEAWFFEIKK